MTAHDETEGIVDEDGARRVVTSTIGVKRMELQQVEAVLLVRLKTDLKALLRFLLVVVLLVMIGTYFLYLTIPSSSHFHRFLCCRFAPQGFTMDR